MLSRVEIRPFRNSDLPQVIALLSATMVGEAIDTSRFTRQILLDANFNPQGAPVAVEGSQIVGFMLSLARQVPLENAPSDAERGYITLFGVAPSHQRRGVASNLLNAAETYLRSHNKKIAMVSSYAPNYFIPGIDVNLYEPALKFLTKHGYKEIYRPIAMECPLWQLPVPAWIQERDAKLGSDRVTIENYHAGLTLALLEFTRAEFPGDWVRVVRQVAERILLGENPARLIVAHENGKVVGFSHFDAERFGPIGVGANQRGRGIGQVLMYRTLIAQRNNGYRTAFFLWSDDKTAARLYTAAGFREVRRFALMKKEL